jgi:hypothetical protein
MFLGWWESSTLINKRPNITALSNNEKMKRRRTTQEPSDLEIAAMAAGVLPDTSSQNTAHPAEPRSRLTKDQHIQYLRISNATKAVSVCYFSANLTIRYTNIQSQ